MCELSLINGQISRGILRGEWKFTGTAEVEETPIVQKSWESGSLEGYWDNTERKKDEHIITKVHNSLYKD